MSFFKKQGFIIEQVRPKDYTQIKKLLIVNYVAGCGDALFVTSVIKAIKKVNPKIIIDLYGNVPSISVFQNNPDVREIFFHPKLSARYISALFDEYDEVLDTTIVKRNVRSEWVNVYDLLFEHAGVTEGEKRPYLYVSTKEKELLTREIKSRYDVDIGKEKIAIVETHASSDIRSWRVENGVELGRRLVQKGYKVFLTGQRKTNMGKEEVGIYDLFKQVDFRAALSLISFASLVVGPDSYSYHAAAAFNVPSVPIFSSFDPYNRMKYYNKCYPVYKPYKCGPCFCHTLNEDCPTKYLKEKIVPGSSVCMDSITVDEVMEVVNKAIKEDEVCILKPPIIIERDCPVCFNKAINNIIVSRKGDVYYRRCASCGLLYVDKFLPAQYTVDYLKYYERPKVLESSKRQAESIHKAILDNKLKVGSVFEVGCATGQTLKELKTKGWQVEGCEVIKFNNQPSFVHNVDFEDYTNTKKYDLIFGIQVLEHFKDTEKVLLKIKNMMHSKSILFMHTPDANKITSHADILINNQFCGEHTHLFTQKAVQTLCARIGFQIVRTTSVQSNLSLWLKIKD